MIAFLAALQAVTVSPSGPVRSLAEAVRQARPGDTIVVEAGTYDEPTVLIDRPVTVLGRGGPVFDGDGERELIRVTADGVTIRGLVLRNTGTAGAEDRAALRLTRVRGCVVEELEIRDAFFGIYGEEVSDCRIARNVLAGPGSANVLSGNAVHCWSCTGVTIEGNTLTGHRDGVYLEFNRHALVADNRIHRNLRYGLHFMFSDSSVYRANAFTHNGAGVAVMYTRRVTMEGNTFASSRGSAAYGLLLKEISDSRIEGNTFAENTIALYLENSNRNRLAGNTFRANGRAVRLLANAVSNEFSGNVFTGNSFDVTTNSRSATSSFTGNYWDRYRGWDLDGDGAGDVSYRPVRLFGLLAEQNAPAIILLRSPFVELLDVAERALPVLTPASLADPRPLMAPPR